MEISEFKSSLYAELLKRGISEEIAKAGISGITKDLTDEKRAMIERISTPDDLRHFADALATRINAQERAKKAQKPNVQTPPTAEFAPVIKNPPKPAQPSAAAPAHRNPAANPQTHRQSKPTLAAKIKKFITAPSSGSRTSAEQAVASGNPEGAKTFRTVMICSSPLWILGLLLIAAAFAILFGAVAALIVGCILVLIAITVIGVCLSLIGIIYGIIKLFSVLPEGIYEIGLAAVIAGITMLVGILLYNVAVRYIPMLFPPIIQLFRRVMIKVSDLYFQVKKECYNR